VTLAPYLQRALIELVLLAGLAGVLGSWIVLRGLAFFTHAVGTATFPGLVVAGPWGIPAQVAGLGAALGFGGALERLQRNRRVDSDAATGLLLVGALAAGVVLASDVYHSGAGVDRLLFGSLIALEPTDLWLTAGALAVALIADAALARAWLAAGFDADAARAAGVRTALADRALLLAVAAAVAVCLSAVGALLVSVVLVVPAATVRRFEPRLMNVRVTLAKAPRERAETLDRTLRLRVEAVLRSDPVPEQISFETQLRPVTLDVSVREG
jgi:manganese/iron transport system permease protein